MKQVATAKSRGVSTRLRSSPLLQQQFSTREAKNDMAVAHKSVVKIVIITPLFLFFLNFISRQ